MDVGTTNSAVAVRTRDGRIVVVPPPGMPAGIYTTPSVVAYNARGQALAGPRALQVRADGVRQVVFRSIKRLLGRTYEEAHAAGIDPNELGADPSGRAGHLVRLLLPGGRTVRPEEVMAQLMQYLARIAGAYLGGAVVTRAVIGIPSDYDANQCRALEFAGELCNIRVQLVREPELAVRAYGLRSSSSLEERASGRAAPLVAPALDPTAMDEGERHILVVDIGGGTLDICLVRELTAYGDIHILFTAGDDRLGGDDFDEDLMKWALKEMEDHLRSPEVRGWPVSKENKRRLKLVCRRAKEQLSSSEMARIEFAGTFVSVSRDQFNELAFKTLERMLLPIRQCCAGAQVKLPYETLAMETFREAGKMRNRRSKNLPKESAVARVKNLRKRFERADLQADTKEAKKSRKRRRQFGKEDTQDEAQPQASVDEVLCIGAASWMPAVRETLGLITGVEPTVSTVDPETAVALGAAMYAAVLDAKMPDTQVQSSWRLAWAEFLSKRPDLLDRVREESRGRGKDASEGAAGGGASGVAEMQREPAPVEQR